MLQSPPLYTFLSSDDGSVLREYAMLKLEFAVRGGDHRQPFDWRILIGDEMIVQDVPALVVLVDGVRCIQLRLTECPNTSRCCRGKGQTC